MVKQQEDNIPACRRKSQVTEVREMASLSENADLI